MINEENVPLILEFACVHLPWYIYRRVTQKKVRKGESDLGYKICLRHSFRSNTVISLIFFLRQKDLFSFTRAQRVLCYHPILEPWHLLLYSYQIVSMFKMFK